MAAPKLFGFELRGEPEAACDARRELRAGDGTLPDAVQADVLLLVTELVTNAIRHGPPTTDPAIRVEVRQWPQLVHVSVFDKGGGFTAHSRPPRGDSSGGWGLYLVDQIADSWAIAPAEEGTCVWFELVFSAA
jgi:anti-sigma regulatory factor (Ser/Thr protein kinase)